MDFQDRHIELVADAVQAIRGHLHNKGMIIIHNLFGTEYAGYAENIPIWIDDKNHLRIGDDIAGLTTPAKMLCDIAFKLDNIEDENRNI